MSSWQATIRNCWLNRVKWYIANGRDGCPACKRSKPGRFSLEICNRCPAGKDCTLFISVSNYYRKKYHHGPDHKYIMAQFCLEMYWKRGGKLYTERYIIHRRPILFTDTFNGFSDTDRKVGDI